MDRRSAPPGAAQYGTRSIDAALDIKAPGKLRQSAGSGSVPHRTGAGPLQIDEIRPDPDLQRIASAPERGAR